MADADLFSRNSINRQIDLFDSAKADHGLNLRSLETLTGIPYNTLRGWSTGTVMPAWALGALGKAGVPDELLSLVLAPYDRHVGTDEDGEGDFDTLAGEAIELAGTIAAARHPKSPGGVAIVHTEAPAIRTRARRVCATARRVAA
jgi:hypothetical protein